MEPQRTRHRSKWPDRAFGYAAIAALAALYFASSAMEDRSEAREYWAEAEATNRAAYEMESGRSRFCEKLINGGYGARLRAETKKAGLDEAVRGRHLASTAKWLARREGLDETCAERAVADDHGLVGQMAEQCRDDPFVAAIVLRERVRVVCKPMPMDSDFCRVWATIPADERPDVVSGLTTLFVGNLSQGSSLSDAARACVRDSIQGQVADLHNEFGGMCEDGEYRWPSFSAGSIYGIQLGIQMGACSELNP